MAANLFIRTRTGDEWTVPLTGQRLSLGRTHDNDVSFPEDRGLSRRHLLLERDGDGWTVRDLGSKNGTYVNGAPLDGVRRLRPGDVISAGQVSAEIGDETGRAPAAVEFLGAADEDLSGEGTLVSTLDSALSTYGRRDEATAPAARPPAADGGALRALVRAGLELAARRPLPELFSLILDLSMEIAGARRGVLLTLEKDDLVAQALRGETFRISTGVRDRVLQSRQSMLVRDTIADEDLGERPSIHAGSVGGLMAVPLQTADRVIGLIYIDWAMPVADLDAATLDHLTVLGNIAAIRIEQERLAAVEEIGRAREQELEQAAGIQRGLLPGDPPRVDGLDLAGSNAACHMVGGDYYDFIPLPDGTVALLLGDVSGKGMPAALLMVDLRARIQVLIGASEDPAAMMALLDRHMEQTCPSSRFVTLFLAIVEPATGRTRYCNAGHNPPFVVRRDGRVERLTACGLPLGMMPGGDYETRDLRLDAGDLLVLYSDGVTEAPDASGEEFGEPRFADLLVERRAARATAVLERVDQALRDWTQDLPAADDVTLLVAKRT